MSSVLGKPQISLKFIHFRYFPTKIQFGQLFIIFMRMSTYKTDITIQQDINAGFLPNARTNIF